MEQKVRIIAIAIAVILTTLGIWNSMSLEKSRSTAPVEVSAQIAEQNRISALASELRQAEIHDLVELYDGRVLEIHQKTKDGIGLKANCDLLGGVPFTFESWDKTIKRVIQASNYSEMAKLYIRCERTK